jgi:hypothetical protein
LWRTVPRSRKQNGCPARRELEARLAGTRLSTGPFYFPDLLDAHAPAEQAAIDAG